MRLKNPELMIPKDDPFKEDALKRKESAEILTQFISTIQEPFVLAVDSPWGTGKTTFLKMWKQHLENEGYRCLLFNAWSNDFYDDPLIPLVGEISSALGNLSGQEKTRVQEIAGKLKRAGAALVKKGIPALLKIGTHGVLDLNGVTEGAIADTAQKIAEEQIEEYDKKKRTVGDFREQLAKAVEDLRANSGGEAAKPVVFFIDELDRCRPTYAIELLERVKHLFGIEGIVFVLAVDKEQIGYSIQCMYGAKMNADGYLRRFIDMDYSLPRGDAEAFCNVLLERCELEEYLRSREKNKRNDDQEYARRLIGQLSTVLGISLRVQEQCVSKLSVAVRTTPLDSPLFLPVLTLLILLRETDPDRYRSYVEGIARPESLIQWLQEKPDGRDLLDSKPGIHMTAWLFACSHERYRDEVLKTHQDRLNRAGTAGPKDKEYEISRAVCIICSEHSLPPNPLRYLADKIEIAERFSVGPDR